MNRQGKKTIFNCQDFWLIFIILVILLNAILVFNSFIHYKYFALNSGFGKKLHHQQPFYARGIYLSSWTVASPDKLESLLGLARQNQINTLVIDLKDSRGLVAYDSQVPLVNQLQTKEARINNLKQILSSLNSRGFYLIARLSIFQDTELAEKNPAWALRNKKTGKIWRDNKGLAWVDPAAVGVWDYNLAIAKEVFVLGFNEINFDYVRFPSDGDISQIAYPVWDSKMPKAEVIRQFFAYQKQVLEKYGPRSIDLFGLTLWHADDQKDMNIGQLLVNALPYFDYICPMVYPSHYPSDFEGFANPAQYPYEIIYRSLNKAQPILTQQNAQKGANRVYLRPWLQAFDLGATYDLPMIEKEIQAASDGGGFGWLLWNAGNDYSSFNGYK